MYQVVPDRYARDARLRRGGAHRSGGVGTSRRPHRTARGRPRADRLPMQRRRPAHLRNPPPGPPDKRIARWGAESASSCLTPGAFRCGAGPAVLAFAADAGSCAATWRTRRAGTSRSMRAYPRLAYISPGTWSLAGLELNAPVLSEASRAANFTNEGRIDATTRFQRNVKGLWLMNESMRSWRRTCGRLAAVRALREHTPHRGRRVKQRRALQADRTRDRAAGGRRASGGDGAGQRPGPGSRVRSTGRGSDRDADAGAGHPAGIGLATNADEGCDEHPDALNLSSLCGSAASRSKGSPDE